ncbi:MAG: D-tyrosyl-tRNA(Tyr) deacylase [Chloroflexi bacterium]|nr:D-tyrosyl-tRNA(Tyr) deacylase [Chloroflexota bacterium]
MRALLQRVTQASVTVDERTIARIGTGLVLLIGIASSDTDEDARYLLGKAVNLRIFPDDQGRFDVSAMESKAALLLVSQFTLYADTRKGRRPGFTSAASPEQAQPMFERFVRMARETGLQVETGRFQEHMLVEIHNDGPVTIMLDTADRHRSRSGTLKDL